MKKAEILSIGTELLMGQIANTDAQYLSKVLPEIGFGVYYHTVVGDNAERLAGCLKQALERSDLVITTGGLGPTQDDLTKKTVAAVLGRKMIRDTAQEQRITAYFKETGRQMATSNYAQADIPEGAVILENDWGTAPGCIVYTGEISRGRPL